MALIGANDNGVYVANPNSRTPGGWQSYTSITNSLSTSIKCWS